MNKATKTVSALALSALVGLGAVAAPAAAAPAATRAPAASQSTGTIVADSNKQTVADIFAGINAFRATKGLKPVKYNPAVSQVAQGWSAQLARTGVFQHNPNYAASPTLAGWTRAGEVIASRYDRSGAAMVQQWINSPGHNAILSDPRLNTIGIGITYTNGSQAMYGVVNFFQYSPDHAATVASPAAVR